ncbi:MAG: hypothetical protein RLZZ262_2586, partial [Bacteroidota bacterium]
MHKLYTLVLAIFLCHIGKSQTGGFTSGPIPLCDTVTFTQTVTGSGPLGFHNQPWWPTYLISNILINITTDHPQTLKISITSPQGTTLLLSAFNGNGGINYTNCLFTSSSTVNITTGFAPFTGNWVPQGGTFSVFNGQNKNGIWTITIIDTACAGGNTNGVPWTSGYFHGGSGSAGSSINFTTYPASPPSQTYMNGVTLFNCSNDTINLLYALANAYPTYFNYTSLLFTSVTVSSTIPNWQFGQMYTQQPGQYTLTVYYPPPIFHEFICTITIQNLPGANAGNDTVLTLECSGNPVNLFNYTDTTNLNCNWHFNNTSLSFQNASTASIPGQYQLIAENDSGCIDTVNIQLNPPPPYVFDTDQFASTCSNTSINLTSFYNTIGFNCSWYFNGIAIPTPINITNPGIYSLVVDSAQCLDTVNINLTHHSAPQLGYDTTITACNVLPLDLSPLFQTSGLTAIWKQNGNALPSPPFAYSMGIYELNVTDTNGCSDTVLVSIYQAPASHLGNDTTIYTCTNSTVNLTSQIIANGNNISWLYNGSSITSPTNTNIPGDYTVIASDIYGCIDSSEIILQLIPTTNVGNDQTITNCAGNPIDLNYYFNLTGLTTNWSFSGIPVTNANAVTQNGSYMLLATNGNNCTDTAYVHLINYVQPYIGPDYNFSGCVGDTLDLTTIYSTTVYTSNWYSNGTLINSPNTITSSGVYQLIISTIAGCMDTAEITYTVYPVPTIINTTGTTICTGQGFDLTQIFSGAGYQSIWSLNGNPVSNPFNVSTPGNYSATISNIYGCTTSSTFNIQLNPTPQLGSDQNIQICDGQYINLNSYYNTNNLLVQWSINQQLVASPYIVNTAGVYELIATNNFGCSDTTNIQLVVAQIPELGPSQNLTICNGQTINPNNYFNTNGFIVSWNQNGTPLPNLTSLQTSGQYQIIISNQAGCTDTSTLNLYVQNGPNLGPDQTIILCEGLSANLQQTITTSGYNIQWFYLGQVVQNPDEVVQNGNYTAITYDTTGCIDTLNVQLIVNSKPNIENDTTVTLCPWQNLDISAYYHNNGLQYTYSYNGHQIIQPYIINEEGLYIIVAQNINGCIDSAHLEIKKLECKCDADIQINTTCIEEKGVFEVIADSSIIDVQWSLAGQIFSTTGSTTEFQFDNPGQYEIVATVNLSCGTRIVKRSLLIEECSSMCNIWIPNSFTPNNDGINDEFIFKSNCQP